jgi:hypothetical protein
VLERVCTHEDMCYLSGEFVALWFNHGVIGVILQRFWCLFVICELKRVFLRHYKFFSLECSANYFCVF